MLLYLLLGLGMKDVLKAFHTYVSTKYNAEAGFITMNLPKLTGMLASVGIKHPIVCSSINVDGFRMSGGKDVYEKLIKHYTAKQWRKDPKELPKEIIKRLPVRFTYDNNYFNDTFQGIPIGGYTQIFEKLLVDLMDHSIQNFRPWLHQVTRNFCLMELRKEQSLLKKTIELEHSNSTFMESSSSITS